jgi:phospholipase/carboxylesterase
MNLELGEVGLRLREAAGEPVGALVLNHGRGADENDLFDLIDAIDPERRLLGVTTGAPIRGIPPGGRHWYIVERVGYPHRATFEASLAALAARLDRLLAERGIGWERTVLGGFSQGGVMAMALALDPDRPVPAAVFALSSFIPAVEGWKPDPAARAELPVLIHHGTNDPVIPVGFARRARELLRSGGIEPRYLESGAGHWLPPELLPELREFVATAIPAASTPAG